MLFREIIHSDSAMSAEIDVILSAFRARFSNASNADEETAPNSSSSNNVSPSTASSRLLKSSVKLLTLFTRPLPVPRQDRTVRASSLKSLFLFSVKSRQRVLRAWRVHPLCCYCAPSHPRTANPQRRRQSKRVAAQCGSARARTRGNQSLQTVLH